MGGKVVALRAGRHAGEPDRRAVPGRGFEASNRVAVLPRGDPARDRSCHEPGRPADRPPLRLRAAGGQLMAAFEPGINLRGGGRVRRRKIVNRIAEALALLAALLAIFVLGIVVWSVA